MVPLALNRFWSILLRYSLILSPCHPSKETSVPYSQPLTHITSNSAIMAFFLSANEASRLEFAFLLVR